MGTELPFWLNAFLPAWGWRPPWRPLKSWAWASRTEGKGEGIATEVLPVCLVQGGPAQQRRLGPGRPESWLLRDCREALGGHQHPQLPVRPKSGAATSSLGSLL